MPNYGRSGRCLTCKRRRVKCDELRPGCSPCRRLGLKCEGYTKDYTFKDQTHKFEEATNSKRSKKQVAVVRRSGASDEAPSRSLLTGADVAVPFYLVHYAAMGRSLAGARGFYETLIPTYESQPHDSPLSFAVSAVATRVMFHWTQQDAVKADPHSELYGHAVKSLRSALERPEDRCKPATVLAILALHLYESISAVYDARPAASIHHRGALSLLPIAQNDSLDDLVPLYVKGFVLHTEISSALRQKRSIDDSALSYFNGPGDSISIPGNFSSTLDSIGASVAELQAAYVRVLSAQGEFDTLSLQQCKSWIASAAQIDELLQIWARKLPDHWRPVRLKGGQDFDRSIPAYQATCDIYQCCQIATLWNLWRFHRLLLLKITVGATHHISTMTQDGLTRDADLMHRSLGLAARLDLIQSMVDGICYSIPFYTGNRTKPSSLNDFADQKIMFPSYHSLPPGDSRIIEPHGDCDVVSLSKDDHHRHMVAYGAWHAMSPLSNLLSLVSDEHGGRIVASALRPGQQDWIREQFLRISKVMRVPVCRTSGEEKASASSHLIKGGNLADSTAENLAKQVRRGTRFMSGP